jgi:hypothetical protein
MQDQWILHLASAMPADDYWKLQFHEFWRSCKSQHRVILACRALKAVAATKLQLANLDKSSTVRIQEWIFTALNCSLDGCDCSPLRECNKAILQISQLGLDFLKNEELELCCLIHALQNLVWSSEHLERRSIHEMTSGSKSYMEKWIPRIELLILKKQQTLIRTSYAISRKLYSSVVILIKLNELSTARELINAIVDGSRSHDAWSNTEQRYEWVQSLENLANEVSKKLEDGFERTARWCVTRKYRTEQWRLLTGSK